MFLRIKKLWELTYLQHFLHCLLCLPSSISTLERTQSLSILCNSDVMHSFGFSPSVGAIYLVIFICDWWQRNFTDVVLYMQWELQQKPGHFYARFLAVHVLVPGDFALPQYSLTPFLKMDCTLRSVRSFPFPFSSSKD